MKEYIPLISGFIGALIGAAASIVAMIIQSHYQNKRERVKEAISLALQDWRTRLKFIKEKGGKTLPLAVFVHYHTKLIEMAEKGEITPHALKELSKEQDDIIKTIEELTEPIRDKKT